MRCAEILAGLIAFATAARSQQTPPLKFEVVSIHHAGPEANTGRLEFLPGGRFRAINYPLRTILTRVLHLDYAQIVNAPEWVTSERYSIEAKAADENASEEQMRQMVIALFVDRFHMKFHREAPATSVYLLTIDKRGSKLHESAETSLGPIQAGSGSIVGKHTTTALLATILTRMLGRPVVDETKLDGKYDFQLRFDSDSTHGPDFRVQESDASTPAGAASIFTAIQEQMGLRLESAKRPIEVFVIDSIERPAEN